MKNHIYLKIKTQFWKRKTSNFVKNLYSIYYSRFLSKKVGEVAQIFLLALERQGFGPGFDPSY